MNIAPKYKHAPSNVANLYNTCMPCISLTPFKRRKRRCMLALSTRPATLQIYTYIGSKFRRSCTHHTNGQNLSQTNRLRKGFAMVLGRVRFAWKYIKQAMKQKNITITFAVGSKCKTEKETTNNGHTKRKRKDDREHKHKTKASAARPNRNKQSRRRNRK